MTNRDARLLVSLLFAGGGAALTVMFAGILALRHPRTLLTTLLVALFTGAAAWVFDMLSDYPDE